MSDYDRERRARIVQSIDPAHAAKVGVAEVGEPAGALAQCELERRNRRQLAAQTQELDRVPFRVGDAPALTEAVVKVVRRRHSGGCESRIHIHNLRWLRASVQCANCAVGDETCMPGNGVQRWRADVYTRHAADERAYVSGEWR